MTSVALDDRITAAFLEGAKSEEIAPLIAEAEAAAVTAGEAAERARDRALDPALSAKDLAAARRAMDDAAFQHDRMERAAIKLGERLRGLQAQEEDQRRWLAYEKAKTVRDQLAAELAVIYPAATEQLADLVERIDANDRDIDRINTRSPPSGAERLLGVEQIARGLRGFVDGTADIPRITKHLRLPAFEYDRRVRYAWPKQ